MKRRRFAAAFSALIIASSLLFAVSSLAGCGSVADPEKISSPASTSPESSFVTFDVSLNEYRGRPLVLAFMASW
jgi:hypothetical protein